MPKSGNTLTTSELQYYVSLLVGRKRFTDCSWGKLQKDKRVFCYKDADDNFHRLYTIHIWSELKLDNSLGIHISYLDALIHLRLDGILVIFKRPYSRVITFFKLPVKRIVENMSSWPDGSTGQVQVPINQFIKLDEFES